MLGVLKDATRMSRLKAGPETQEEVDRLATHFCIGQVLYDP
jgi:hypothetical protein